MDINRTGLHTCHVTPCRHGERPPFMWWAELTRRDAVQAHCRGLLMLTYAGHTCRIANKAMLLI